MYRKNGHLACKNRANGRGRVAGLEGAFFLSKPNNLKEIPQVLDFQGFELFRWLLGGF